MTYLTTLWARASAGFAQRAPRERAMALVIALATVALLGDRLFLRAANLELRTLQLREAALAGAVTPGNARPIAAVAVDERRRALEQALGEADALVARLDQELVPAAKVKPLLTQLLADLPGVRITGLHELSTQALDAGGLTSDAGAALLYRHGFEVRLQGSYPDLLRYLDRVEALPQRVLWRRAALDASGFPTDRLTLVIYTLSKEPTWLSL